MRQIRNHQQGAALAISLILLVAMTILGFATLNGTRLAEQVSSNAQQKSIVYETAESVIDAIHDDPLCALKRVELYTISAVIAPRLARNSKT